MVTYFASGTIYPKRGGGGGNAVLSWTLSCIIIYYNLLLHRMNDKIITEEETNKLTLHVA